MGATNDNQNDNTGGANENQENKNNDQNGENAGTASPSNKPPSTGGNVMGQGDHPPEQKNDTAQSNKSQGSPMPGAWPNTGPNANNSANDSNGERQSPPADPTPPAGNVVSGDDWGANTAADNTWQNQNVAVDTGGFWDSKTGQADLAAKPQEQEW